MSQRFAIVFLWGSRSCHFSRRTSVSAHLILKVGSDFFVFAVMVDLIFALVSMRESRSTAVMLRVKPKGSKRLLIFAYLVNARILNFEPGRVCF